MEPSELAKAFAERDVQYCIVGGVAVTLYGVLRNTFDLDILLVPTVKNLEAASSAFDDLGLQPHIPIVLKALADKATRQRLREQKNLIAIGYVDSTNPLRRVDVLLDGPFDVAAVIGRAIEQAGLKVIAIDDLITMKRAAGRTKDLEDADWLEALSAK